MSTVQRMSPDDEKHLRQYVAESEANGRATSVFRFQQLLNEIDYLRTKMTRIMDKTPGI